MRSGIFARMRSAILIIATLTGASASAQQSRSSCLATASSLTPGSWRSPAGAATNQPKPGLRFVREIPLPGPANRFDYQSVDPGTGRIYMNHMNAGRTVVFDANAGKVVTEIMDLPRATGVWAVPSHHQVYVSAAGAHQVAIIDDRTLKIVSRVGDIRFPDGIAYAPEADKVFSRTNPVALTSSSTRKRAGSDRRSTLVVRQGTRTTTRFRTAFSSPCKHGITWPRSIPSASGSFSAMIFPGPTIRMALRSMSLGVLHSSRAKATVCYKLSIFAR